MLPVLRVKRPSVRDGHTSSLGGFQSQHDTLTRERLKLVTRLFAFVSFNETERRLTWMNIPWLDSAKTTCVAPARHMAATCLSLTSPVARERSRPAFSKCGPLPEFHLPCDK